MISHHNPHREILPTPTATTLLVLAKLIAGMQFFVTIKQGDHGYTRLVSQAELDALEEKTEWLN